MQKRILQKIDFRIDQVVNSLPVDRAQQEDYLKSATDSLKHEFGPGHLHNYLSWLNLDLARLERETGEMIKPLAIVKQAGLHLAIFIAAVVVLNAAGWLAGPLTSPLMALLFNLVVILLIINVGVNFYQSKRAVWRARRIRNWLEQNLAGEDENAIWEADTILI